MKWQVPDRRNIWKTYVWQNLIQGIPKELKWNNENLQEGMCRNSIFVIGYM